jgi:hypothetical protein
MQEDGMENSREYRGLSGLGEINYELLQDGTPDIGGWDVITEDGAKVGEVRSLVGDVVEKRIRYIDVDVNEPEEEREARRHLLVPIGGASIDRQEERVVLKRIGSEEIVNVPRYDPTALSREYEDSVRKIYEPSYNPASSIEEGDYYQGALYDDTEFFRAQGRV